MMAFEYNGLQLNFNLVLKSEWENSSSTKVGLHKYSFLGHFDSHLRFRRQTHTSFSKNPVNKGFLTHLKSNNQPTTGVDEVE